MRDRLREPRTYLIAIALAVAISANAGAGAPLDIPIPEDPTLEDILSTSNGGGEVQGIVPGAGACDSAAHRAISLPADDRPHNTTEFEYWWWYGHLESADGRRFAYDVTFSSRPWAYYYGLEYNLTDLSSGTYHWDRHPLIVGRPRPTGDGFVARADHASASLSDNATTVVFDIDGYDVALSFTSGTKPPILAGGDGHQSVYCQSSYEYSRVRMPTIGTIRHGDEILAVTGVSTLHHQWGFLPPETTGQVSSKIWSFELDDGRDIFAWSLSAPRRGQAVTFQTGYISDADGNVTTLRHGDFTATPTRFWRRDATCEYPVDWDVDLGGIHLHAQSVLDGAEMRPTKHPEVLVLFPSYAVPFWDGETVVSGDGTGRGWVDVTHYCAF